MMHTFWPGILTAALMLTGVGAIPASAALTIFGNAPRVELQGPGSSFELGTVFQSSQAGQVTGLRFYMGPIEASNPSGAIIGKLWTSSGTLLASVVFPNPTEGWNEVALSAAVSISASTSYVVSANNNLTTQGTNYSTNEFAFFAGGPFTSGPLTATAGTFASPAGTFPTGIFPSQGGGSFYGRDVIFEPAQTAAVPEPASLGLWSFAAAAVFGSKYRRRTNRPRVKLTNESRFATTHRRLERLENRLAMSGFGPEDGSYIVDSAVIGRYDAVSIQPGSDRIVVAGSVAGGSGLARSDSQGAADPTFSGDGAASLPAGGVNVALQPDGKAVTGGSVSRCGGSLCAGFSVTRVDAGGTLDSNFGSGGTSTIFIPGNSPSPGDDALVLQSTGKIVIGGSVGSSAAIARFTASGAVDSGSGGFGQSVKGKPAGYTLASFASGYNSITSLAIQADDKIVAVGAINLAANNYSNTQMVVARFTASGTLDKSFNGKGFALFGSATMHSHGTGVLIQPDGKIIVSGFTYNGNSNGDGLIARYNTNGTLDSTFTDGIRSGYAVLHIGGPGADTFSRAHAIALQPDGKIVVAGTGGATTQPYSVMAARLNVNGSIDTTFGNSGYKIGSAVPGTSSGGLRVNDMALQSDGSIIVAGVDSRGGTGDTSHPMLMRFYGGNAPAQANSSTATSADAPDAALLYYLTDPLLTSGKRKA